MRIKKMKTNFFLERTQYKSANYCFMFFILFSLYGLLCMFYNSFSNINIALIIAPLYCFLIKVRFDYVSGLIIDNNKLIYIGLISKKNINIHSIKCIRFYSEYVLYDYLRDKDGNILYCVDFYASLYEKDEMNSLEFIEEIKRSFVEKKLASCIYDKEALDYILSLNPDIKVFYPEDF